MMRRMVGRLACLIVSCVCLAAMLPVSSVVVDRSEIGGRSAEILWWYDLSAPSFGSSAVGDIDGDGGAEIVFGTYFGDECVYALNAEDGSLLWSYDTGGCNDASAAIADVDLDGGVEVIVGGSSACTVFCFAGATGGVEWSRYIGHSIDSPPAVADVDADGTPEVVVGAFEGYVFCLRGEDGVVQWQQNVGLDSYIESCPTVLDVDGDGLLDVVVAQWMGDCRVFALHGMDGAVVWSSAVPTDYMYHGPSFGDLDEDGLPELAIGCYDNRVYVLNAEDGSLCWSYPTAFYVGAPTCLADLNGDGSLEVVFCAYNVVGVLSHSGSLLWSISVGGGIFRGVAIGDVDGNRVLDLAFGCDDGKLRVLRGDTGGLMWSFDLAAHYGAAFPMDHAPVLADLNGDGMLEVFIVGGHGEYPPEGNYGRAYALTAGGGSGAGWPMFHHDLVHSGRFALSEGLPPVVDGSSGPLYGRPGVNYTFSVSVSDPDGDMVMVLWDFGDGSVSGWLGPFASGSSCSVSHAWAAEGVDHLRVKLRDEGGMESEWISVGTLTVDGTSPVVELVRPQARVLYLGERFSCRFFATVLIGVQKVEASASDALSGVEKVEFLLDGMVVVTSETPPYTYVWGHATIVGPLSLSVVAVDRAGNRGETEGLVVWKLL